MGQKLLIPASYFWPVSHFPVFAPFCHLKRENSGTANSVLNSFSFWAQTRFLRTSNGKIHPKKEIFSASSKMCGLCNTDASWCHCRRLKDLILCFLTTGAGQGQGVLLSRRQVMVAFKSCKRRKQITEKASPNCPKWTVSTVFSIKVLP